MIRFENVSLHYGNGPDILQDICFDLPQGSFHFLTGPSGAGKTSLLRLIFLAIRPSRGKIYLFDNDIADLPRRLLPKIRRKIGVVFQEFRLLDHLTIYDNVALPLRVIGQKEVSYRDNILELLHWVGLGDKIHAFPTVLSGGEKQRAAIARAVVARPGIIVADEPTGNVDADMGARLMQLFIELNKLGTTVMIATHDTRLCQDLHLPRLHLEAGRLVTPESMRPVSQTHIDMESTAENPAKSPAGNPAGNPPETSIEKHENLSPADTHKDRIG